MFELYEVLRFAAAVIVPNRCPFCDGVIRAYEYAHEECLNALSLIKERLPVPEGLSELYAYCAYEGVARDAVLRLKEGCYIHAAEAMSLLMTEDIGATAKQADVITSVPSSFTKVAKRGYSPAEEIAKGIARRCGVRFVKLLMESDNKSEQKALSEKERMKNVKDAFEVIDIGKIQQKNILLVDDVCTTGSTLSACAKLLLEHGASSVTGAVFAKTMYD